MTGKTPRRNSWTDHFLKEAASIPADSVCVPPTHPTFAFDLLKSLWDPNYEPPQYSLGKPDWLLAMTAGFLKDIASIDRKLQGRVLEAISQIVRTPTTPRGNTVKPLTGEMGGLWRYRVGDYRLVYQPVEDIHHVQLKAFSARGNAYE